MDLEQIVALLPSTKGVALADLVKQSLISPAIVHYSALLQHPVIAALENSEQKSLFNVVKLFCYGTLEDYSGSKSEIGYDLSGPELAKLKLLSLIQLASQYHELDYDSVISKIDLDSHTQLEELFINANAAGFITGKMDQEKRRLYVSTCVGRDAQPAELSSLKDVTSKWAEKTRGILIETINAQNAEKLRAQEQKNAEKQLNDEIRSIKEAIKLEQESQNRRPSSSTYREENSEKKFVRKEAIDMTAESEMKPKKYKLRGRKN